MKYFSSKYDQIQMRESARKMRTRITPNTDTRVFPHSVRIRENAGKMRTRITLNTDNFTLTLGS